MVKNSNLAKEFELKNKSSKQSGWDSAHLSTTLPPQLLVRDGVNGFGILASKFSTPPFST